MLEGISSWVDTPRMQLMTTYQRNALGRRYLHSVADIFHVATHVRYFVLHSLHFTVYLIGSFVDPYE